jgi:hypothetical protein
MVIKFKTCSPAKTENSSKIVKMRDSPSFRSMVDLISLTPTVVKDEEQELAVGRAYRDAFGNG